MNRCAYPMAASAIAVLLLTTLPCMAADVAVPGPTSLLAVPSDLVVIRNGARLRGLSTSSSLMPGDILKVGSSGSVDLRIGDQAIVRVRPGATLRLIKLQQAGSSAGTYDTRLKLDVGALMVKLQALSGQSTFVIETPSAVTAARGTSWLVDARDEQTTTVLVDEGTVGVSLPGSSDEVKVGAQFKTFVRGRRILRHPLPFTAMDRQRVRPLAQLRAMALRMEAQRRYRQGAGRYPPSGAGPVGPRRSYPPPVGRPPRRRPDAQG